MAKEHYFTSLDVPALARAVVGFDRIVNNTMRDSLRGNSGNYPPHNVIKVSETGYIVELAVAGFNENELLVEVVDQMLHVSGDASDRKTLIEDDAYLHRGISNRSFTRTFALAEHVEVQAASYRNGILSISLEVVIPEEKQPKKIAISYDASV